MEEDKVKKMLKNIKPENLSKDEKNKIWNSIIHNLSGEYNLNNLKNKNYKNKNILLIMKNIKMNIKMKSAYALIALLLVFGSFGTAVYADSSKPGDLLFPIDIASENIRLAFSFGKKKDELRIKFAKERVEEAKEVVNKFALVDFEDFSVDNSSTSTSDTSATSTQNNATTTTDGSNQNNATNTSTSTDDNSVVDVSEDSINQSNEALIFAIEYLNKVKEKMIEEGNEEGLLAVESMISELKNVAENQLEKLEKIKTKIEVSGDSKTKVKIELKTEDIKAKFKFDEKKNKENESSIKIDFDKKVKNKDKDDDNKDDDDDKDDDDNDHHGDKETKKVKLCHNNITIEVSKNSAESHLKLHKGDHLGECGDDDNNDHDDDDHHNGNNQLVIKNVEVFVEEDNDVEIKWKTNKETESYITYSTSTPVSDDNSVKIEDDETDDSHKIKLRDLPSGTTFYFVIFAEDKKGNTEKSEEFSFTTNGSKADTTPPQISGLSINKSTSTAEIMWNTDEDTSNEVLIATSSPVSDENKIDKKTSSGTTHSVLFEGLTASTTYHVLIISTDSSGNTQNKEATFTTDKIIVPDTTPPVISSISTASNTISWITDEPATSKVIYSTTTPVDISTANVITDNNLVTNHSVNLSGVQASTTIYFLLSSTDESGNTSTTTEQSFTTE